MAGESLHIKGDISASEDLRFRRTRRGDHQRPQSRAHRRPGRDARGPGRCPGDCGRGHARRRRAGARADRDSRERRPRGDARSGDDARSRWRRAAGEGQHARACEPARVRRVVGFSFGARRAGDSADTLRGITRITRITRTYKKKIGELRVRGLGPRARRSRAPFGRRRSLDMNRSRSSGSRPASASARAARPLRGRARAAVRIREIRAIAVQKPCPRNLRENPS